jgi:hypothetical protein
VGVQAVGQPFELLPELQHPPLVHLPLEPMGRQRGQGRGEDKGFQETLHQCGRPIENNY